MRSHPWIIAGCMVLLVASLPFACWRLVEDTEYAPGFTQGAFEALALGSGRAEVMQALGAPLATRSSMAGEEWLYCEPTHPGFAEDGSATGTFTRITVGADGRVTSTIGQVETRGKSTLLGESGSITFGPGFLGLAPAQERALVGVTTEALRARFGPPRHVRARRAVETLIYSRSPSSSDYQVRHIGLDEHGFVVEKVSYRYAD